jgi:hypothetical protein
MGNVIQVLPGLHPHYRIPASSGNHTRGFTDAAATPESHEATIRAAQALTLASLRVFDNREFLEAVHTSLAEGARGGRLDHRFEAAVLACGVFPAVADVLYPREGRSLSHHVDELAQRAFVALGDYLDAPVRSVLGVAIDVETHRVIGAEGAVTNTLHATLGQGDDPAALAPIANHEAPH